MPIKQNKSIFITGLRDGIPIALAYFAVAFSLGISASLAGLSPIQGFTASILTNASAGEYAGFAVIKDNGSYLEMVIMSLVASARYLLMACALSQRISEDTPFIHRLGLGFYLTDELFGISVARPGKIIPSYTYGAAIIASPAWALGTVFGIVVGNILPARIVSALSVALYGMFLAIVIPPARDNRVILGVVSTSFAASLAFSLIPGLNSLSAGTRIIILTVVISSLAAAIFPVEEVPDA